MQLQGMCQMLLLKLMLNILSTFSNTTILVVELNIYTSQVNSKKLFGLLSLQSSKGSS